MKMRATEGAAAAPWKPAQRMNRMVRGTFRMQVAMVSTAGAQKRFWACRAFMRATAQVKGHRPGIIQRQYSPVICTPPCGRGTEAQVADKHVRKGRGGGGVPLHTALGSVLR